MTRPKPLFIMGNKRSGSTLMTDLLNSHAHVFVSHESDIAWLLYQSRNGRPARYQTHPLDSRLMLDATLKSCRRILKETLSGEPTHDDIVEAFHRAQDRLLGQYLKPSVKQRLKRAAKIIGKKPTPGRVLRFLDLEMTDAFAGLVKQVVYPKDPNTKYASFPLPDVPRARPIMELYRY